MISHGLFEYNLVALLSAGALGYCCEGNHGLMMPHQFRLSYAIQARVSTRVAAWAGTALLLFVWQTVAAPFACGAVKQIVAHRGSSADRPENTLAAITRAIEAGATAVEADVRTTSDGHLVILHDATLDRTTTGSGNVAEKTLAEVRRLDAGSWFDGKYSDQQVPTLRDVLTACGGKIDVLLDLKQQGEPFARRVADEVKSHGSQQKTIVGVRTVEQARLFRKLLPEARQLGLIPRPESIEGFAEAGVEMIRLWPRWLKVDSTLVARVRKTGATFHLNGSTGQPDDVRPLLVHRPDSLSSDDPARLVETLAQLDPEAVVAVDGDTDGNPVQQIALLPPGPDNPRNSEGDFIRLKDGRMMLIYTHFTGGAGDHAQAHLAARFSRDGGATWTDDDVTVIPNEGDYNIMSVSLLRLADGRIALFYLRKNSLSDCRPVMRTSSDEAKSWSEPAEIIPESHMGYYVLNNDRVVQLKDGRIILPLAQHHGTGWEKWTGNARILCWFSDDSGRTWQSGDEAPEPAPKGGKPVITQEPGVLQLQDGRVMLWCRTSGGTQYVAMSEDRGATWSRLEPSEMKSPVSPATIERIPSTGDLLLVWNDHRGEGARFGGKRTPLTAALSTDEGRTWSAGKTLADNPHGWYCYTAMTFVDGHVLLAYCGGDRRQNNGLAETHVARFPVKWLYPKQP